MRELLWAGTEMSAFKKTALVAELGSGESMRTETRGGWKDTYHFSWGEVGPPPSGGISGTTVVALSPDTVSQLGCCVVGVADQIIGRGLIVLRLVRRPKVLHGVGRDWVGSRGIGIRRRVCLGVSRAIVMWRGRLVVKTVRFGGGVPCLHYDLIWMGRRGIKVPLLLRRELERRGEKKREGTRLTGTYMGRGGGPGRAICSQRRGRLLELNLGRRELDAFVRSVLPLRGVRKRKGRGKGKKVPREGV